jgi:hypothetical protein
MNACLLQRAYGCFSSPGSPLGFRGGSCVPGDDARRSGRLGLSLARASWLLGVSVRRYRELEDGERSPDAAAWRLMCGVFRWPQSFTTGGDTPPLIATATLSLQR